MTSYVNNVQYGSITIAAGQTTNTYTLPQPILGTAWVEHLGNQPQDTTVADTGDCYGAVTLSGQVVTATIGVAGSAITIYFCVTDANSNLVTSIQQGTIQLGTNTSQTGAISAVVVANSTVIHNGQYNPVTMIGTMPKTQCGLEITATNQVTAHCNTANSSPGTVVAFTVINWNSSALNSNVQQFNLTSVASSTTDTQTITSVNASNSLYISGGWTSVDTSIRFGFFGATLTNGTTVTYTRGFASANTRTYYGAVVEFISGVMAQAVQRGVNTITAGNTSQTTTITSGDPTAITLRHLGSYVNSNTQAFSEAMTALTLTNGSTITAMLVTPLIAPKTSYEAVNWNGSMVGQFASTEGADTMAATATQTFTGSMASTEGADVMSATATMTFTGAMASTEGADIMSGQATLTILGSMASSEAPDVMSASATMTGSNITGTGAFHESSDIFAGTAQAQVIQLLGSAALSDKLASIISVNATRKWSAPLLNDQSAKNATLSSRGLWTSTLSDKLPCVVTLSDEPL